MAKIVSAATQIGEGGIALIYSRTVGMGFIWHSQSGPDSGIDGQIEIRDQKTGTASNLLIGVQSKATDQTFSQETESSFAFYCKSDDISYWLSGNLPVILICSRPRTDEAYWLSLKEYFRDPTKRTSGKVIFDKKKDVFDASAIQRLAALAAPIGAGLHLGAPNVNEQLWSNLLPVRYPQWIYTARTDIRDSGRLYHELNSSGGRHIRACVLHNGSLISVHPLDEPPLNSLCDQGTVEKFSMDDWALADDDRQWTFSSLMWRALSEKVSKDLEWSAKKECFYFRARVESGGEIHERVLAYPSIQNMSSRDVVMVKRSKKDPSRLAYVRHNAFSGQFIRLNTRWYLSIDPTYYFTRDGRFLHDSHEKWLSGSRRLEKNQSLLGQVIMWAWYLRQEGDLFNPAYPYLSFGPIDLINVDKGFDDSTWGESEEEREENPQHDEGISEGPHQESFLA